MRQVNVNIARDLINCGVAIVYRPIYRKIGMAQTVKGCLLAAQLLYIMYTVKQSRNDIQIEDEVLANHMEMTIKEIRSAREDLKTCGFFTYLLKGIPRKGYYSFDEEKYLDAISEEVEAPKTQSEPDSPGGRTVAPKTASSSAPEGSTSIAFKTLEREEPEPKPKEAEALCETALSVYTQNKPEKWPGKRAITGELKALLLKKFVQMKLSQDEFMEMLTKALQRCHVDQFPRDNYTLATLLRINSTHLTDLSEKYDQLGGAKANAAPTQKLKSFTYSTSDDLF